VRVADSSGRRLSAGEVGECQVRRRGLKPHYWRERPENSGLLTEDGWLRTGDLALRNRLGLIRIVGRIKDVIKSGGYSVYVPELEEAMLAHPEVAGAVAFGLPHKEKGEIPVAAVELRSGAAIHESELLEWCRQRLAAYKSPRHIWIVAPGNLPRNSNGKLLRWALRERYGSDTEG